MLSVTQHQMLTTTGLAAIQAATHRPADYIIGGAANPYLLRWHVVPETAAGNIYLHKILRNDDDRALHDHPWDFASYIIQGAYAEILENGFSVYRAGGFRECKAETPHRLEIVDGPVWTLVITGPRRREWGFHCPQGWVPWQQFVDSREKGLVGRGCGG